MKAACSSRLRHFWGEGMTRTVDEIMELAPVIPVLVIERVEDAQPIAHALVAGGLPALEVTMRTSVALQVMREMAQVPVAIVGAGTVLNPKQLAQSMESVAQFIVRDRTITRELHSLMRLSYSVFSFYNYYI